ncbi:hypothetical protein QWZ13_17840 [Reinekea marina]|uniref:hypothetical protein n=1 Tax=Reinekea marina TaxID=1310421 RepID=UPI0025B3F9C1|nr:hypothetical protein [Reinekea marina]MDN3650772.1 hypothetical protein [Reinekea marina]
MGVTAACGNTLFLVQISVQGKQFQLKKPLLEKHGRFFNGFRRFRVNIFSCEHLNRTCQSIFA